MYFDVMFNGNKVELELELEFPLEYLYSNSLPVMHKFKFGDVNKFENMAVLSDS